MRDTWSPAGARRGAEYGRAPQRACGQGDGESDVLAKIAEMPESDLVMAERLHAIIKASTPTLSPKLWCGMPAYAKDGKVVGFFQRAEVQVEVRDARPHYAANLDGGAMWPTAFTLTELTATDEADRRAREECRRLKTEPGRACLWLCSWIATSALPAGSSAYDLVRIGDLGRSGSTVACPSRARERPRGTILMCRKMGPPGLVASYLHRPAAPHARQADRRTRRAVAGPAGVAAAGPPRPGPAARRRRRP
jgi:hypothetical protein